MQPPETVYVTSIAADETNRWGNDVYDPSAYRVAMGTMSMDQQHNFRNSTQCGFRLHMGTGNLSFPRRNGWRVQYLGFTVVDCIVSDWTRYSACTKTCGGGTQFRTRRILQTPLRGGKPCPPDDPGYYRQSRRCKANDCVGNGVRKVCGGTTTKDHTEWKMYGTRGLVLDVGTAFCRFETATQYAVSIIGDDRHWQMAGACLYTLLRREEEDQMILLKPC